MRRVSLLPGGRSAGVGLAVGAVAAVMEAQGARAADLPNIADPHYWTKATGGVFEANANWDPNVPKEGQTGGIGSDAMFTRVNATYTVTFGANHENQRVQVSQGAVTFDLDTHTYRLEDVNYAFNSNLALYVTGSAGTSLTLRNGTLVTGYQSSPYQAVLVDSNASLIADQGASLLVNAISLQNGNMQVRNGAQVILPGNAVRIDVTNGLYLGRYAGDTGNLTVTGAGSEWRSELQAHQGQFNVGGGSGLGSGGQGTLVVADGGKFSIADGVLQVAVEFDAVGTVRVGTGGSAGVVNVPEIRGGSGTATLQFNHTDGNYFFTRDGTSGGAAVAITGRTHVSHNGSGKTTLTGANTYTGGTDVTAGTLAVSADNNLGATSSTLTFSGGTLQARGSFGTARAVVLGPNGGTFDTNGNGLAVSGVVSGSGALTKVGGGTLTLTGANTYAGGTTVSGGILQVGNGGTTGSITGNVTDDATLTFNRSDAVTFGGAVSGAGGLAKMGTGTLTLTGANTYAGGTSVFGGATLQVGNGGTVGSITGSVNTDGTLIFNRADAVTFGGVISGAGDLVKAGTGTLMVTGANTYAGSTTVSGGALQVGNGGTTGTLGTGNVTNNGTLIFNRSNALTFGGAISGTGALAKVGFGTLVLTGANTYTGGTSVFNGGTLHIGNGGTAGSIAGNVNTDGTLVFNRSDAVTFGGAIAGAGALVKMGGGTLTLTGANTYAGGTTVSGGTCQVGDGGTSGSITGNVIDNATLVFNRSDAVTFGGAVSGTGGLAKMGAGTLILAGTNTYTGGTSVFGGATLQIGNGGAAGSITGNVNTDGALIFNRSDALTFGGAIAGAGTLVKAGNGTLRLAGANTYAGPTTIASGSLVLNPASWSRALSGGGTDLQSGLLIFDYSGTATPRAAVASALYAGKIHGSTLTQDHGLAATDDGSSLVTVRQALYGDTDLGGSIDADDYARVDRGRALHLAGWANGDFNNDGSVGPGDYVLMDIAYGRQIGVLSAELLTQRQAQFGEAYVQQLVAAVPEPASLGLLGLVGVGSLRRRRK